MYKNKFLTFLALTMVMFSLLSASAFAQEPPPDIPSPYGDPAEEPVDDGPPAMELGDVPVEDGPPAMELGDVVEPDPVVDPVVNPGGGSPGGNSPGGGGSILLGGNADDDDDGDDPADTKKPKANVTFTPKKTSAPAGTLSDTGPATAMMVIPSLLFSTGYFLHRRKKM